MVQTTQSPFGDPNERRSWLPAYAVIFEIVSTFFFSLRLISRFINNGGGLGLDDIFLILGWAIGTGATILFMLGALFFGFDRHISAFTPKMAVDATLNGWLAEIFYLWTTGCTKIAVLLFYRRLIRTTISRGLRWAIWLALSFTACYTIGFTVILLVGCNPVEARWMKFDPTWRATHKFKCLNSPFVTIPLSGALSVFSDVYALAIPAILLSGLQMARRQKIGLYIVFALGVSVVGAGIVRTIFLDQTLRTPDVPWVGANTLIASTAEVHLAIICACAPSLRSIFKQYFRRPASRYSTARSGTLRTKRSTRTNTYTASSFGHKRNNSSFGQSAVFSAVQTRGSYRDLEMATPAIVREDKPHVPPKQQPQQYHWVQHQQENQERQDYEHGYQRGQHHQWQRAPPPEPLPIQSGRLSRPSQISDVDFGRGNEANYWASDADLWANSPANTPPVSPIEPRSLPHIATMQIEDWPQPPAAATLHRPLPQSKKISWHQ